MHVDDAPGSASSGSGGSSRPTRWVSLARACELLGVNESTVRRWADSGEIQVFRTPGGHRRFAEAELLAMIQGGGSRRGRRNELEEEVGEIGEQYGRELRRRGTPLAQAVQAFIFFRKSLDETAKRLSERNRLTPEDAEKAREAIAGLADRVLIGLTSVYNPETR